MNRVILTPATLPSSALAEVKQWLGITTAQDDAALQALLETALDQFEAFTGQRPLESECEETLDAAAGWMSLATRPVQAITSLETLAADGSRMALATERYDIDLDADGTGRIRLLANKPDARIAVRFTAGLSAAWDDLPQSLRHGVIRLAAHQHRERETEGAAQLPPASVAALWRPWRSLRLA
ncbi:head-tail connector protein [Novosphingobium mathurense]|uniref:Phage gp6-like head-tail connector protein n=1 Tax=Novosphingobium mathurense TaxID=428990 RepID=A0A1U6HF22_9SPHN|nr:phage head-tail connector protein [Novosphingobium mathurense]SLJ94319.1 phage conserved hypothetical protein, phiE125 gp8 family [Novosphingobium mathurense]